MATIFQIFLAAVLLWGPSLLSAAENGDVAMVKTIQFEEQDGVERVVIGLSGKVETKIFELPGENPRVVCDLLNTGYPANLRRVISARGDMASRIRVGIHNKPTAKTRIVIDLVANVAYSFEHSFREADSSLVLTLSEKSEPKPIAELLTEMKTEKSDATKTPQNTRTVEENKEEIKQESGGTQDAEIEEDRIPVEGLQDEVDVKKERTDVLQVDSQERSEIVDEDIPVLLDVSFERNTNDKEMVLFHLSGFHPPVIFSTENDDLLVVCDFFDALLGHGVEPVVETEGKYISRVRISKHESPDKVRVVLDLVDQYNYDLKQVFFREDNLFVVIISNLGEKELN